MQGIKDIITRYPIVFFFLLAYLFSWPADLLPFENAILDILSVAGPTLAAVIVVSATYGREATNNLFAKLFHWRVGSIWYFVAILGPFLLTFIAVGILVISGETTPGVVQQMPWGVLPAILVGRLLINVWEEIGWRGFALPQLQSSFSALVASLIVGALWAIWHVPLFLSGSVSPGLPFIPFLVEVTAISVIYTWIYNNTNGSLLLVTLFHIFENTAGILVFETGINFPLYVIIHAIVILITAMAVVIIFGPARLSRDTEPIPRLEAVT